MKEIYSKQESARIIGISKVQLDQLASEQKLAITSVGITRAELEKFLGHGIEESAPKATVQMQHSNPFNDAEYAAIVSLAKHHISGDDTAGNSLESLRQKCNDSGQLVAKGWSVLAIWFGIESDYWQTKYEELAAKQAQ